MFKFGLNKEERKIFINTMNELRELKEELSLLKKNINDLITPELACSLETKDFLKVIQKPIVINSLEMEKLLEPFPDLEENNDAEFAVQLSECQQKQEESYIPLNTPGKVIETVLDKEVKIQLPEQFGDLEIQNADKQRIPEDTCAEDKKPSANLNWAVVSNYHQKKSWWSKCQTGMKVVKRVILKA